MVDGKILVFILLVSICLSTVQVSAADYSPSVVVGDYVKFGNVVGVGPGLEDYNENDWFRYDVVDVIQTQVTLRSSGRFKNGTAIPGDGIHWSYDVEIGIVNGTTSLGGPIIAGNLSQGDLVNVYTLDKINRTITKTYLGFSRQVNVLNFTQTTSNATNILTYFYDRQSGMLLEFSARNYEISTSDGTIARTISYSVVETNIFERAEAVGGNPYLLLGIAVGAAVIVFASIFVLSKRFKKTKSET